MSFALFIALLLLAAAAAAASARDIDPHSADRSKNNNNNPPGSGSDAAAFFGPGGEFNLPGYGGGNNGWASMGGGYGAGYGGPRGGFARGGVDRPSIVCVEKGPCYKKKLTCPANCFTSYSRSGRNYGGGGGGGGCTMDCKKKCTAYC